jgi:hypothetical protein
LRKRQQDVQGQSTHAGRGVEGLRDRDERDLVSVEEFDELSEIGERSGRTINLVDDDDVDPLRLYKLH